MTRTSLLRYIKIGCGALVALLIIIYAISRSLSYARGPHITVDEPTDWAVITSPTTMVRGHVDRANNLTLDDHAISIDEQGNFSETLVIFPGMNIITIEAHDQFNRTVKTQLRVQGNPL